jgi:hypothetical protein
MDSVDLATPTEFEITVEHYERNMKALGATVQDILHKRGFTQVFCNGNFMPGIHMPDKFYVAIRVLRDWYSVMDVEDDQVPAEEIANLFDGWLTETGRGRPQ